MDGSLGDLYALFLYSYLPNSWAYGNDGSLLSITFAFLTSPSILKTYETRRASVTTVNFRVQLNFPFVANPAHR